MSPILIVTVAIRPNSFAVSDDVVTAQQLLGGRKSVAVYADNESAAMVEAERLHEEWGAVSAKKVGGEKSRMYRVVMVKKTSDILIGYGN